ncbi:hypothetical protein TeGR_g14659 [Tetraparma gracilis]|uniref:PH domain-containing protein n=1 Tax=Tetraparma gracilis TaxID=2962635 RepID=A0ABQ6N927_9STRA|nr:hypothetical protein TeGR_g14659 [Tetraparma gracilis]
MASFFNKSDSRVGAVHAGWLEKRGEGIFSSGYKRRWFVLTRMIGGGCAELKYFTEEGRNGAGKDNKGKIILGSDLDVVVKNELEFELTVKSRSDRVYKMKAESKELAEAWVGSIRAVGLDSFKIMPKTVEMLTMNSGMLGARILCDKAAASLLPDDLMKYTGCHDLVGTWQSSLVKKGTAEPADSCTVKIDAKGHVVWYDDDDAKTMEEDWEFERPYNLKNDAGEPWELTEPDSGVEVTNQFNLTYANGDFRVFIWYPLMCPGRGDTAVHAVMHSTDAWFTDYKELNMCEKCYAAADDEEKKKLTETTVKDARKPPKRKLGGLKSHDLEGDWDVVVEKDEKTFTGTMHVADDGRTYSEFEVDGKTKGDEDVLELEWPYFDDDEEVSVPARGERVGNTIKSYSAKDGTTATFTRRGTRPEPAILVDEPEQVDTRSFGASPEQPEDAGGSLDDLRKNAVHAREVLDPFVRDWLGSLGMDPDEQHAANDEEGKQKVFPAWTMAPLKTEESCTRKVRDDYGGKFRMLGDIVRGSIVVATEKNLKKMLDALLVGRSEDGVTVKVVRLKNRFANPMFTGIRDCLINIVLVYDGGSHCCEIQLHLAGILALKGACHRYYDFFREYFTGTAASYQIRLELFEKVDVGAEGNIEASVKKILVGGDKEKVEALGDLTAEDMLGDPVVHNMARGRLAFLAEHGDPKEVATAMNKKGQGQIKSGDFEGALVSFKRALKIRTELHGEGSDETISIRQNIAMVYDEQEEYEKALKEYEHALKLAKASSGLGMGEEGLVTAKIIGNMAGVYNEKKDYEKALELLLKSFEMKEKLDVDDSDKVMIMGIIAQNYAEWGKLTEAMEWNERTLAIQENILGKGHPQTLACLSNMAHVCMKAGTFDRAAELLERAIEGQEGQNDKLHNYMFLVDALRETGDLEKAEKVGVELVEKMGSRKEKHTGEYAMYASRLIKVLKARGSGEGRQARIGKLNKQHPLAVHMMDKKLY